jgi:diguanylate cyclase
MVGLVALLGVPMFLYVTVAYTQQQVEDRGQILYHLANTAAIAISENLRERSREVELLARSPLYVNANFTSPEFRASLERLQQSYSYYSWIGLTDINGTVQAATGGLLVGQSVAQRPWFQEAKKGVYVGDLHEAKLLAALIPSPSNQSGPIRFIDFAVQVENAQGQPRGVLGVHAHWGWSEDLLNLITPQDASEEHVEFFIVNGNNEVIFPDVPRQNRSLSVPVVNEGDAAHYASWGSQERYLTSAVAVNSPDSTIPLNWKVLVRQPEDKVLAHARGLQRAILAVFGVGLVLFLILAWLLSRQLGRPIQQLTHIAQAIAEGKSAKFDLTLHTAEMRSLNQALQEMATRLLRNQHELEAAARELENKVEKRTQELAEANTKLAAQARNDALTGLPNRLSANEFLAHEFHNMKRGHESYSVVMLDIDHFKKVNDTHGHATGDKVLQHVSRILAQSVRENDFVGRMGGEEFVAVLPLTQLSEALLVAEKIRASVSSAYIEPIGQVSISAGVAVAKPDHASADDAVNQADAMLYEAKRAGRNRVMPNAL